MMKTIMAIGKPVAFGLLAALVGVVGSYALAKAELKTQNAIIGANIAAGMVLGAAVGQLDESAGIVTAMPFMVTSMQNLVARLQGSASQGGATATNDAAPSTVKTGVAGLYGKRLMSGITVDDFAGVHRLGIAGIRADDFGGITADDFAGVHGVTRNQLFGT